MSILEALRGIDRTAPDRVRRFFEADPAATDLDCCLREGLPGKIVRRHMRDLAREGRIRFTQANFQGRTRRRIPRAA